MSQSQLELAISSAANGATTTVSFVVSDSEGNAHKLRFKMPVSVKAGQVEKDIESYLSSPDGTDEAFRILGIPKISEGEFVVEVRPDHTGESLLKYLREIGKLPKA